MTNNFAKKLVRHVWILSVFVTATIGAQGIAGQNNMETQTKGSRYESQGPYCGVNCVYVLLKSVGLEPNYIDLLQPKYIGSDRGSSLSELKIAAQDNGAFALPIKDLDQTILEELPYPIILHVKSDSNSVEYDHYKIFLGIEDDRAKMLDPPNPVELLPFYDLAGCWNGSGVIVSDKPIDLAALIVPARLRLLRYSGLVFGIVLFVRWVCNRWPWPSESVSRAKWLGFSTIQCSGLCILAFLVGLPWHLFSDIGFLAHAGATNSVQYAHQAGFIPKVSAKEVMDLISQGSIVIVDARFKRDYESGHLNGAINIPIDSLNSDRQKAIEDIAKEMPIVVYCQSNGCVYDQKIALKLIQDGYSNVSIFKGGWVEWVAVNGNADKKGNES